MNSVTYWTDRILTFAGEVVMDVHMTEMARKHQQTEERCTAIPELPPLPSLECQCPKCRGGG